MKLWVRVAKAVFEKTTGITVREAGEQLLKSKLYEFAKKANEKGWTKGVHLTDDEIVKYLYAILLNEDIPAKEIPQAQRLLMLFQNAIFAK